MVSMVNFMPLKCGGEKYFKVTIDDRLSKIKVSFTINGDVINNRFVNHLI